MKAAAFLEYSAEKRPQTSLVPLEMFSESVLSLPSVSRSNCPHNNPIVNFVLEDMVKHT